MEFPSRCPKDVSFEDSMLIPLASALTLEDGGPCYVNGYHANPDVPLIIGVSPLTWCTSRMVLSKSMQCPYSGL
ncbi:unnamed protein product [Orchesella dallaii]|uniref:Uncharacterized protein n=1 Tax=Orchesella dallaii TaxID=48710 RepID=A0ABP1RTX2_9HEXA